MLRRTWARGLVDAAVPPMDLTEARGWSNVATVCRDDTVDDEELLAVITPAFA